MRGGRKPRADDRAFVVADEIGDVDAVTKFGSGRFGGTPDRLIQDATRDDGSEIERSRLVLEPERPRLAPPDESNPVDSRPPGDEAGQVHASERAEGAGRQTVAATFTRGNGFRSTSSVDSPAAAQ